MRLISRSDIPFLSIITMSYMRPRLLEHNQARLDHQTCQDFEQLVIYDDVGRGWPWVAEQYREAAKWVNGRYVMYVEDDDELASNEAIAYLRDAIGLLETDPDVIVAQFGMIWRNGRHLTIPEPEHWGRPPVKGAISGQCIIAQREVWQRHAPNFGPDGDDEYAIDIQFIRSVLKPENGYRMLWLPYTMAQMQVRGYGKTEAEMEAGVVVVDTGYQSAADGSR